jgi:lysophospholipase L1-like esterase
MWTLRADMTEQFGAATSVDEHGLRAVERTGAPVRILTLGDSSIFGHALENPDTLHAQLREALAQHGIEADVLCGAVPGYSTEQTLLLLEEVGWDLAPDLLVIGTLWSDNNIDRFVDKEWMALLNGPFSPVDRFLSGHSDAWQHLRLKLSPLPGASTGVDFSPVGWIREPDPAPGRRRVSPTDYARNLDTILRQASSRGVGAVMLQPANPIRLEGEIDRSAWQAYFEILEGIAKRRGVPVVDAVESLKAAHLSVKDAFLDDLHPTGVANGAVAGDLARVLVEAGWPGKGLQPDPAPPPYDRTLRDPWLGGTGGPAWRR